MVSQFSSSAEEIMNQSVLYTLLELLETVGALAVRVDVTNNPTNKLMVIECILFYKDYITFIYFVDYCYI